MIRNNCDRQFMTQQNQNFHNKTTSSFYLTKGNTLGSDYIYDQTYKSYKAKQKFEKNPKFSYFNAVMQMRNKLSTHEEIYKNVFEVDTQEKNENNQDEKTRPFYLNKPSLFIDLETEFVKIQRLKRNSFKLVKEQPISDHVVSLTKNPSESSTKNKTLILPSRTNIRSNMSVYDKPKTRNICFEMNSKARDNKSYVELQVKQKPVEINMNQTFYQPTNPKPRLDEIMNEYRKTNKHSHQPKSKKSSLPKEFVERLYQTNKMLYSNAGKKRSSLY